MPALFFEVPRNLTFAFSFCKQHKFDKALARLRRIPLRKQARQLTWGHLMAELWTLYEALEDDAKDHHFYHYPVDKAALVRSIAEDWSATLTAFPSAKKDVEAATDCFALGHSHASIYHSMMVLVLGLPALANRLRAEIKKERPTWRDITDIIRKKIDERRAALSATPKGSQPLKGAAAKKEHDFLGVCGEAALDFKFFEHAWRNHIAHGRAAYDETDAKKVLDHVRTFMETISTKLKLKEKT